MNKAHLDTAPAGYMEAGPWTERWCEDHPEAADPTASCRACLGESHDAWMHRAKEAERERDEADAESSRLEDDQLEIRDALCDALSDENVPINCDGIKDAIARLAAERKRLEFEIAGYRAALERIEDHPNWFTDEGDTRMCDQGCMDHVISIAREALRGDDD